jgi:calcium permeable stress-gated cation channel
MARREMLRKFSSSSPNISLIFYEIDFVHMRHQFLISKSHSRQANARTVLITNLPGDLSTDHDLREWASFVPGGIERTWVYRDTRDLNKLFERREKACSKLEKAAASLMRDANKAWKSKVGAHDKEVKQLKQVRKQELKALERAQKKGKVSTDLDPEQMVGGPEPAGVDESELVPAQASWEFLEELIPMANRPQVRPGKLGWAKIGRKYDAYGWCKVSICSTTVVY